MRLADDLVVPNVKIVRGLNLPGTPWATSACCGITFTLLFKWPCFRISWIFTKFFSVPSGNCGWSWVKFLTGTRFFFQSVRTKCGAPAANSVGTGALCSGVKRPRREADHSSSVEVKNKWSYISSPSTCRDGVHRHIFTSTCQFVWMVS